MSKNAYKTGVFGEFLALNWLRLKGYSCLNQRYKTPVGEIDLVMLTKKTICFVEVKHYMTLDQAAYSITTRKKQRIARTASLWMQDSQKYAAYDQRFDALLLHGNGLKLRTHHIKSAWRLDEIGVNF